MAIQMMGAMLAQKTYTDDAGLIHIVSPISLIPVPVASRRQFEKSGKTHIVVRLPECVAVLSLWGGNPGDKFTITGSLVYPSGDSAPGPVEHNEWPDSVALTKALPIEGEVPFEKGGIYKFKFLIDGEPVGELPLAIYWEDELPALPN